MASNETEERWHERYEQLAVEMTAWRNAHPRATFNDIDDELDKRMNPYR